MSTIAVNDYIKDNYLDYTDKEMAEHLGLTAKAVRSRRCRMGLSKANTTVVSKSSSGDSGVTVLQKLLKENNISINEVGSVRISSYQQGQKNEDGESEVVNLGAAAVTLKVDSKLIDGPEWPVIAQAAPVNIKPSTAKKVHRALSRAVILPDPQIGFRRDLRTGKLDPFHDEKAMSVALAIIEDVQPDVIVNLGDFLDFPMFGRFEQEPGFQLTTQATLDAGYRFLAEQRALAPDAEIVLFEGNHDIRLQKFIIKNAMAAFGLTRAEAPDEWPVLSIQHLLRLDELDVKYVDGYPSGEYYINNRLKCEHGFKHGPRGKIASKIVEDEDVSVITGHMHRVESIYRTTKLRKGTRLNMGTTLGCLCRIDGAVPSTKSSIDAYGKSSQSYMDWQQAVGVVEFVEGDGPFHLSSVIIHEGEAVYKDKLYCA